jgi:hypothetical protein
VAARDRDLLDRVGHVLDRNPHESFRNLHARKASLLANLRT